MHASVWENASLKTSEASHSDKTLSLFRESDKVAATISGRILEKKIN
jgi:hypothetical protein